MAAKVPPKPAKLMPKGKMPMPMPMGNNPPMPPPNGKPVMPFKKGGKSKGK